MPPLYQRIKDYITSRIDSGEYKPGSKVPSENQLLREIGASRMTVNRAIRELTEQGVLYRVAGVGTFVAEAKLQHPSSAIQEIRQEIEQTGRSYYSHIIKVDQVPISESLADAMQVKPGSVTYHSR
ncbi:MAG: GntR family transcriptional regulator, partial [Xanthomonadales bacterium]|nr:GntR family transcriptional regulator [Xanthomonadales bacterium]